MGGGFFFFFFSFGHCPLNISADRRILFYLLRDDPGHFTGRVLGISVGISVGITMGITMGISMVFNGSLIESFMSMIEMVPE